MKQTFSIGIPTYNRKDQLLNQLHSLFKQDLSNVDEIIIVDNHSNYDVSKILNEFEEDKIRLITNKYNIRMPINMVSPFLHCRSDWIWLLSDDDLTAEDSIQQIYNEIQGSTESTGMIKFARSGSVQEDAVVTSLEEYIDYYYNENSIRRGDLVFISTNVYNLKKLEEYIGFAFEYSYTYIPQLIPIFKGLEKGQIHVKFSSKQIVKFIPPREGWYSFATIGKGFSTISHLPLNLNKGYYKKFLNCTMSITPGTLINRLLNDDKAKDLQDAIIIYNNIYRYYLPIKSRIILQLLFLLMSNINLKKITLILLRFFKKI